MSTSGKYPDHLSQSALEIPSGEDLEAMIARLDQKWRELKELLRAEEDFACEEEQTFPEVTDDFPWREAADAGDPWWNSLPPFPQERVDVSAQEAEAIIEGIGKIDEDTGIREQLVKIQWQNRGLIVYSVICTIMFLYLLVSVFFSNDSYAVSQNRKDPASQVHLAAGSGPSIPAMASATLKAVAATAGDALISPGNEGNTRASPHEPSKTASSQTPGNGASAAREAAVPKIEYLGSITSNKYHYRSCKWANFINPSKERVFHSVAEARQAGYISCPTCRPPLADEINTSAR